MKRKFYDTLLNWKKTDAGRTALLVDGARRVGKTWIVEQFAQTEYATSAVIDFSKPQKAVRDLFENKFDDLDVFFLYLQNHLGKRLEPGNALVVFDEVQLYPPARAAIKHLVADGRYHYVETGSLMSLRANVKDILLPSEERHMEMFPMDFEEFLWANGNDLAMSLVERCFAERRPLGEDMHRKLMDFFRQYLVVGGMPQVVETFAMTHDLDAVDRLKRDILALYRGDIRKWAGRQALKVERLFDSIPSELSRHEKKFRPSSMSANARLRDYEDAFVWLSDAMMVNVCFNATDPDVGLKMNIDRATRKCYFGDTGLLVSHAFDESALAAGEIHRRILFDEIELNEGMLVENAVAQMFTAAGRKLYFYSRSDDENASNRMEIDFLVPSRSLSENRNISAVEVKSGRRYATKSLEKFRRKFPQRVDTPYVLHSGDVRVKDGIVYLPLYMAGLL